MKPLETVREISALTYGFIASKALFAALELDLFTRIAEGADTVAAIAQAVGIAPNRARTLLTALKTVGLVSEADGRFANAPATSAYLVAGARGDFRDYVRVVNGGLRSLFSSHATAEFWPSESAAMISLSPLRPYQEPRCASRIPTVPVSRRKLGAAPIPSCRAGSPSIGPAGIHPDRGRRPGRGPPPGRSLNGYRRGR